MHPSGSPLVVGTTASGGRLYSFNITATSATAAAGNPYQTGGTTISTPYSLEFSKDGNFVYTGGNSGNSFAGYSVNPQSGILKALPGSPFDSGAGNPTGYATDSQGRIFMANSGGGLVRAFTTTGGVPTAASSSPFTSGLSTPIDGALSPNENFYYAADRSGNRIGAYQVVGNGATTTLTAVSGSPVSSNGTSTDALVFNAGGNFLYAANGDSRNITTYSVNPTTGAASFVGVQAANTLGSDVGRVNGIDYLPSVFTVTNTNDSGAGSLRQAVTDANAAGGGIVNFSSFFNMQNTQRVIFLNGGQITITSNTTIQGTGANILFVFNGAAASATSRVFNITGGTVNLNALSIGNGNVTGSGGGIFHSAGILTLTNSVAAGNTAANLGGGIENLGQLNLINSAVASNTANGNNTGGGIDNTGTLSLVNSTVANNTAAGTTSGGGIWTQSPVTIINSTIANNAASGTGSAGGIHLDNNNPVVTIRNSIVAANVNNTTVPDVFGAFASGGFNLVGNVGTATGFSVSVFDQTGTGASPINPQLGVFGFNNGRATATYTLLANSPAIDKGNSFNYASDERGLKRPVDNAAFPNTGDGADIGAFERQYTMFDFDGDGKSDIGIYRPTPAEWWYQRSSDGATRAVQFGSPNDIRITPADFTGDGRTDIAFFRPSDGNWFVIRSEDSTYFAFPFGSSGDIPAPADFDGDGKADAAVFRPSQGVWYVNKSSGGTSITQFGIAEDKPVVADYDGDGKADIAIFRPSNNSWWHVRSSDGEFRVYQFALGTDKPVIGDWTGDGKADLAPYRPTTGEWFIRRSEDLSYYAVPFGAAGDIPAPGDYDGDGKLDTAVYRPTQRTWYINRSTAGILITQSALRKTNPSKAVSFPKQHLLPKESKKRFN